MLMDKFNDINIFVRSAQSRSFSVAAQQLKMSPSVVSKAVIRLEESLGIRAKEPHDSEDYANR